MGKSVADLANMGSVQGERRTSEAYHTPTPIQAEKNTTTKKEKPNRTDSDRASQAAAARAVWWPDWTPPVLDTRLQAGATIFTGGGFQEGDYDSLSKAALGVALPDGRR